MPHSRHPDTIGRDNLEDESDQFKDGNRAAPTTTVPSPLPCSNHDVPLTHQSLQQSQPWLLGRQWRLPKIRTVMSGRWCHKLDFILGLSDPRGLNRSLLKGSAMKGYAISSLVWCSPIRWGHFHSRTDAVLGTLLQALRHFHDVVELSVRCGSRKKRMEASEPLSLLVNARGPVLLQTAIIKLFNPRRSIVMTFGASDKRTQTYDMLGLRWSSRQ